MAFRVSLPRARIAPPALCARLDPAATVGCLSRRRRPCSRRRFGRGRLWAAHDEHLADAPPFHLEDPEVEPVHGRAIAGTRNASEPLRHESADRAHLRRALDLDPELLPHVVEQAQAVEDEPFGRLLDLRRLAIELVLDLADDL